MKQIKILFFGIIGLAVLAVLALGAAAAIVDGQFVKTHLERAMKEKNRTLKIEGVPQIKLFPVAGITLGKTLLSEPGSDKPFLSLDSAEVAVRVMPLLSGEIAVETLKLSGLKANFVRRKDGAMNFTDLAGGDGKKSADGKAPPRLSLAEASVEKAQLVYRDEASGQETEVTDLNLKTGRLDGQAPGDVSLSVRVSGKKPEIDLRAQAAGALRFDLGKSEFAFDKFSAQLKGRVDQETLAVEFSAPKVEVTPAKASGSEIRGTIQVRSPQRNVDASFTVSMSGPPLAADLVAKLDDSTLKAKIALPALSPLKANFDASIDRLNLDRYLGEKKEAKTDDRVDLGALRGKTVSGKIAIGALTAKRVKLENVKAELKLDGGKLDISPHTASLYGGTLSGALAADADGNKIHVKETAQNVALGVLLHDALQKDMLDGRGNVTLDVQTAGGTMTALKKALSGSARVEMKDGAIKGINLAESARNAKAALSSKQTKADASQKTDFSEMSASFKITNGVAHNDDLKALSPFLRLGGAGNIDIGNNAIDYLAKATLAATAKGQGGRDAGNVAGITVPVQLSGPLDNPNWHVDYSALLGGAAGAVAETAKKGVSGVTNAVRGLFKH